MMELELEKGQIWQYRDIERGEWVELVIEDVRTDAVRTTILPDGLPGDDFVLRGEHLTADRCECVAMEPPPPSPYELRGIHCPVCDSLFFPTSDYICSD